MLKNYMQSTGSRNVLARIAEGVGLRRKLLPQIATTHYIKKGKPFGRYIEHHHMKPFQMVIGQRAVDVEQEDGTSVRRYVPVKRTYESHSFLHATKGWRTFNRILPFALQQVLMQKQAAA